MRHDERLSCPRGRGGQRVSIYKRKSGRYTVVLAHSEGSTKRRGLGTFATKKEAEAAERAALLSRDGGIDLS